MIKVHKMILIVTSFEKYCAVTLLSSNKTWIRKPPS